MAETNVDVFLKPDKILADLEAKLAKATGNEEIALRKQIEKRQAEIASQYGSVSFGSGGYVIPNYAYSEESGDQYGDRLATQTATQGALAGKKQLIPTGSTYTDPFTGATTNLNPIYQAQYYGPQGQTGFVKDPVTGELMDPYAYGQRQTLAGIAGTTDPRTLVKKFYDASGNEIPADQVAKTAQGLGFAKAGWDIGFGPGMLPGNLNAREIFEAEGNDGRLRDYAVNNLVASGEMAVAGFDPVTGRITPTAGNTATVGAGGTTTLSNTGTGGTTTAQAGKFGPGSEGYEDRKSAYDILFQEFDRYGLGTLVTPLKDLITEGVSPSEFAIRLTQTEPYKQRFSANQARISKGLSALSPAAYIGLEDQYQDIMRRYGLPESYYTKGDLGIQEGFNKLISNDVSNVELEDRIATAQNRVVNADPEIANTLKQFYPGISNGDILAYVLDPANAVDKIKRKITAAEIGTAARGEGLTTGLARAEELATAGVTKDQAQQGFQTVAAVAPRGGQLADIYKQSPYTQTTAETEIFGLTGASSAAAQRKKLTELEQSAFSGRSGMGAIARERAGNF
jgi:hypothetical protein